MAEIEGGYYLKARCIQESEIAYAPPHIREIWDWLIKEANHKPKKTHGTIIERGQVFTTYSDILNGLQWKIGWRVERYTKWQCESAMKFLRKGVMITTQKTTRGMIITILNYERYQNPKNYESHSESHSENHNSPQQRHTINKNGRMKRNKDKLPKGNSSSATPNDGSEKPKKNPCPQNKIIDLYHRLLPELPGIQVWDDTSKKNLRARWRQDPKFQKLEFWEYYFTWISQSNFLMGKVNDFQCDLHWVVRPTNFAKIINGRYHNKLSFHDALKKDGDEWLKKRQQQRETQDS